MTTTTKLTYVKSKKILSIYVIYVTDTAFLRVMKQYLIQVLTQNLCDYIASNGLQLSIAPDRLASLIVNQ